MVIPVRILIYSVIIENKYSGRSNIEPYGRIWLLIYILRSAGEVLVVRDSGMSIKVNVVLIQCVSSYNQGGKSPVSLRNPRNL